MTHNDFDREYYVMSVDGANNHPLLSWGETSYSAFRKKEAIDETTLDMPLKIIFDEPYPKQYEMPDLSMLGAQYAGSVKLKTLWEKTKIAGVQFIPIEIESNKGEIIKNHYAIHFSNRLRAIDEKNYEGGEPNRFGLIHDLERFSLNVDLLSGITLDQRLVFVLEEKNSMIIVHRNIYEAIEAEGLTGMRFFRVDEWDDGAIFR